MKTDGTVKRMAIDTSATRQTTGDKHARSNSNLMRKPPKEPKITVDPEVEKAFPGLTKELKGFMIQEMRKDKKRLTGKSKGK